MTERIKTLEEIEAELLRDVPPPLETTTTTTTSSNYIDDGDELMQPRVVCRSAFTERAPTKRRDGDKHTTVLTLDELDEFSSESAYAPVMTADLVVDECGELMARSLVLEARTPEKFDGFMCKMEKRAIELRASLSDNDAVRHGETMETSALDAYKRIMGAYDKPATTSAAAM